MKLTTTSLLVLALRASLLFSGSVLAEEPAVEEAAVEPTPKLPAKSEGCSLEDPKLLAPPGGPSKRLKLGERYLRISLPKNYDPKVPAPLILAYHDFNVSASEFEKTTFLSHEAYNKDAIVVYPEASVDGRWMSDGDPPPGIDDLDFTDKLLNRMNSRLCVDTDRIYATGLGTGGGMVHLLACNEEMSPRIAAYAMINGNIFAGFESKEGRAEVKDPSRMLWERCKPQRMPTRILTVHSENNTVFDYWGDVKVGDRKRMPLVPWLVEWAQRSNCGMALDMPQPWEEREKMYKTILETGYIFEGFIENSLITKATYHCWANTMTEEEIDALLKKRDIEADESNKEDTDSDGKPKEGSESNAESAKSKDAEDADTETEEEKAEKKKMEHELFVNSLRDNIILEHYYIRGAIHGWPRLTTTQPKDEEGKFTDGRINEPDWKDIDGVSEPEPEIDFNEDAFTFLYGYNSTMSIPGKINFDTTVRVLDWFRMFRLSDDPPKASRNSKGLTEFESGALDKMIADLEKAMAENPEPASDILTQPDAFDAVPVNEAEVPAAEEKTGEAEKGSTPKEDTPQKPVVQEKDEL